jgi:kinesin family protein 2/24
MNSLEAVCSDHEQLIKVILEEEEDLIHTHRVHVDAVVDIVKQDMSLL